MHSADVAFDRILGGEDLGINLVDLAEAGIKRRRLAGTGRSSAVKDPVWLDDGFLNVIRKCTEAGSGSPSRG